MSEEMNEEQSNVTDDSFEEESATEQSSGDIESGEYDVIDPDDEELQEDQDESKDSEGKDEDSGDEQDAEPGEEGKEEEAETKDSSGESEDKTEDAPDATVQADRELIEKFSTPDTDEAARESPPEKEEQKPTTEDAGQKSDVDNALDFDLDEDVEPEIADAFGKLKAATQTQQKDLKEAISKIEELTVFIQGQQQDQMKASQGKFYNDVDEFIAGLGSDYADTFGEGRMDDLPDDSNDAINARVRLKDDIIALWTGYSKTRKTERMPPMKDIFKRALAAGFGDKVKQVTTEKVTKKVDARNKSATHRPTNRKGKPLSGIESAYKRSQELDRIIGDDDGQDEDVF